MKKQMFKYFFKINFLQAKDHTQKFQYRIIIQAFKYFKLNFVETRSYSNETNYEIEKLKIELQKAQNQNIEALKRMNDFKKDLYTEREKNSISKNEVFD